MEKLNEITDNKILSEAVRMIAQQTLYTCQDIGTGPYLEYESLIKAADKIDNLDNEIHVCLEEIERDRMSKWHPIETAPKDGTQFLANIGYPWATLVAWNEVRQEYTCVTLSACELGNGVDVWFENEQAAELDLIAWMPLPGIKVVK